MPVEAFVSSLAQSPAGQASARHLSVPFDRDAPGAKTSLAHQQYHMRGEALSGTAQAPLLAYSSHSAG